MKRVAVLLLGVLASLGCSSVPTVHHYVLRTPSTARQLPIEGQGLRVGVPRFAVEPPYDQGRLVYRLGDDGVEVGFYAYHQWAAPLAQLLAVNASDALRGTRGLGLVETKRPDGDYDALLEGRLTALEEVDAAGSILARVSLQLRLRSAEGKRLWSGEFARDEPAADREVRAVVDAMNRALAGALAAARDDLESSLPR